MRSTGAAVLAAAMVLAFAPFASATIVAYQTPSGSQQGGLDVSALAVFTTSADTLNITLQNTVDNPTSVIQNLSDLSFVLSTGQTSGTLTSSSGLERTVAADGTFTDGSTVATGWQLDPGLLLHVLGTPTAPAHTIIGNPDASSVYSNANGSIAGNVPHNPFLAGTVTFVLNIPGLTADSTVTGVTFSFGTTEGNNTTGECVRDCNPPLVPEPSTGAIFLIAGVLGVIATATLRKRGLSGLSA